MRCEVSSLQVKDRPRKLNVKEGESSGGDSYMKGCVEVIDGEIEFWGTLNSFLCLNYKS